MNELFVEDCFLYFKTYESDIEKATDELFEVCNRNGIELTILDRTLRDEEGNDIEV